MPGPGYTLIQMSSGTQAPGHSPSSNRALTAPTHAQPRLSELSEPSSQDCWEKTGKLELLFWCLCEVRVWTNQFVWELSCLSQCEENLYCVGGSVRGSLKLNEVTKVIVTSNLFKPQPLLNWVLLRCDVEDCSKYFSLFNLWFQILLMYIVWKMKPNFKFRNTCYVESLKYGWTSRAASSNTDLW